MSVRQHEHSRREERASDQQKEHKDWEIEIKDLITKNMRHPLSRPCCIYRAHVLHDVDESAFTPKIVSIGPLHHFEEHLQGMEETKLKYLKQFLQHAAKTERLHERRELNSSEKKLEFLGWKEIVDLTETTANDFSCLSKFRSILESLENDIQNSYADNLSHISSGKFLRMILVDAAFVIELFLMQHFQSSGDPLRSRGYLPTLIKCDLWLLENQLPFFVLEQLYYSAFGSYIPQIYPPFLELTCNYFSMYNEQKKDIKREVNHFTDLVRAFYLPSSEYTEGSEDNQMRPLRDHLPSAIQLHAAGVKFISSESKCLLDINFSEGRLEIPSLHLFDRTAHLFRNLIALEQYHYPGERFICDYFTFMDYLLDTSSDVDLLVKKKIIKHWLGSNSEVARLFNSFCISIGKGTINRRFFRLIQDLNEYHNQPWHSWKATLYRQYFNTPWRTASTIAAIILLVLTLAQTIIAAFGLKPDARKITV